MTLCLCLPLCGCTGETGAAEEKLTGCALVFEGGSCAILTEESEVIVMADISAKGGLFVGLRTGDQIQIMYGSVRETYPAQTDIYTLQILERGSADAVPSGPLEQLESMGWILATGPAGEPATEPVLSAVTEPYSGEIPSVPPGDTMPETYLHRNGDRIDPLEQPDHITVIAEFREQMGDPPIPVPSEQIPAIVRQINALELEGYDLAQSRFMQPCGGGYLMRLYYGDQVVTFNFGTDWMISVRYPNDPQARWFMNQSANFDVLITQIVAILS